jgi:hypothetical protein
LRGSIAARGDVKPFREWQKPFIGLAFCLTYPSADILKRFGRVSQLAYCLVVMVLLWLSIRYLVPRFRKLEGKVFAVISLAVLLFALACAYVVIHPQIDTNGFELAGHRFGASDRDDAIDAAITETLNGRYPYTMVTFLGNPITPMPGALLLASPFYLLGDSGIQNIFWLALFFVLIARVEDSPLIAALLAFMMCLLSPNLIYQIVKGSDFISNAIYVLIFAVMLVESTKRQKPLWVSVLWAIMLGIGLSSRPNFLLVLPTVAFAIMTTSQRTTAFALMVVTAITFATSTLPFYFVDPIGFSPLHVSEKLGLWGTNRLLALILPVLAFVFSMLLGIRRMSYALQSFAADLFAAQTVLMVGTLVLVLIERGVTVLENSEVLEYGILFMFFGVFAFGPRALRKSGAVWVNPESA